MVFEFSGDDDVWIFVDGNLVLDLGGIHDATGGKINFATGDVTYDCNSNAIGGKNTSVENIYKAYKIDKTAFSEHTLTMFYLERGEYDSNCKITFNIPTLVTNEDISIKKKVENAPKNNTDTYDFELLYGTGEKKLDQTYKGPYQVYDSTNALVGERKAENGRITLKAGETAVIDKDKIGYNQYYKVREVDYSNSDNYLTPSWIATRESGTNADSAKGDKTSQSGTGNKTAVLKRNFQNSSGSHIEFTNYYKTSKLSLKKMVEWKDKDSDKNASFDFIVTIGTDTYDVSLKDGETKEFEKIPVGTEYTIAEVITAGAIYTAPDTMTTEIVTPGSVKVTTSGALNGKMSESEPGAYLYQVTGKTGTEEGALSMVVYINHEKEAATPTPNVTTSPAVTNTPEKTNLPGKTNPPGVTNTPGKTNPPGVTNTPGKTNPPEVTNTPGKTNPSEVTNTPNKTEPPKVTGIPDKTEPPKVTGIPDKTEPPKETGTPDQTATPKVTDTPQTEIPETKIPNTEVPKTEEPETTPVVIDTPGVPLNPPVTDTETSSGETTLPEETNPPTGITTPPEKTKEPTRNIPDDTDLPGDPAGVNLKNHTDEDDEGETGDTKETEKTEEQEDKKRVIVEDDVPGTLPKTGGMGIFETEKGFVFGWMLLLPIFLVAGSIYLVVRKKNKR